MTQLSSYNPNRFILAEPAQMIIHHYRSCRENWRDLTMADMHSSMNLTMFHKNYDVDHKHVLLCDNFKRVQSSAVKRLADAIRENVRKVRMLLGV